MPKPRTVRKSLALWIRWTSIAKESSLVCSDEWPWSGANESLGTGNCWGNAALGLTGGCGIGIAVEGLRQSRCCGPGTVAGVELAVTVDGASTHTEIIDFSGLILNLEPQTSHSVSWQPHLHEYS